MERVYSDNPRAHTEQVAL